MVNQPLINVSSLETALQKFADERDWQKYHSPKNLAMALTREVGELVEIFQWLNEEQSKSVARKAITARRFGMSSPTSCFTSCGCPQYWAST